MTMCFGKRLVLATVLIGAWLATSACSCSSLVETLSKRPTQTTVRRSKATLSRPTQAAKRKESSPTARVIAKTRATATPRPTLLIPTKPPPKAPSPQPAGGFAIPAKSNQEFTLNLTEAQLNEHLADQVFEQQGVTVQDIRVTLTASEIIATLRAAHEESKLNMGLTVRGVPAVAEGTAYVKINDIALDDSVSGFTRLVAKAAIEQAIEQYSTPLGIPIPIERVEILDIQLMPGRIVIVGRTR